MVRQRNESGLIVTDWCKENGINLKTYYYRLKRVRQAEPAFAQKMIVRKDGFEVEIPTDISEGVLLTLLRGLKEC